MVENLTTRKRGYAVQIDGLINDIKIAWEEATSIPNPNILLTIDAGTNDVRSGFGQAFGTLTFAVLGNYQMKVRGVL